MRIRRVTYDLGNVIERQEYLDGRYGAPGEKRAKKKKVRYIQNSGRLHDSVSTSDLGEIINQAADYHSVVGLSRKEKSHERKEYAER